jgi:hypothetical protein
VSYFRRLAEQSQLAIRGAVTARQPERAQALEVTADAEIVDVVQIDAVAETAADGEMHDGRDDSRRGRVIRATSFRAGTELPEMTSAETESPPMAANRPEAPIRRTSTAEPPTDQWAPPLEITTPESSPALATDPTQFDAALVRVLRWVAAGPTAAGTSAAERGADVSRARTAAVPSGEGDAFAAVAASEPAPATAGRSESAPALHPEHSQAEQARTVSRAFDQEPGALAPIPKAPTEQTHHASRVVEEVVQVSIGTVSVRIEAPARESAPPPPPHRSSPARVLENRTSTALTHSRLARRYLGP